MRNLILIVLISALVLTGCGKKKKIKEPYLKKYFDSCHVQGSFMLYDLKYGETTTYNAARCKQRFSPASTFKILNSLIALETGIATDENFILKWDGVKRDRDVWNQDMDLKTAFKESAVWYYQELARRVGVDKYKYYLKECDYGNADVSGGVDKFWLTGGLQISQAEQIDFLKKLYAETLPFSKRNITIVKQIMLREDTLGYKLSGKTGWADQKDGKSIGWFVGYLERDSNVYFFATNIESSHPDSAFAQSRIDITHSILNFFDLMPTNKYSVFHRRTFVSGDTLNYRIAEPLAMDSDKQYPCVLFLSGSYERGDDNKSQLKEFPNVFLDITNRRKYPCYIIAPQCPETAVWVEMPHFPKCEMTPQPGKMMALVLQLMDSVAKLKTVDKSRIYVIGLSMGGMAIYDLIARRPDLFAAAAAICGIGDTSRAKDMAPVKLWIFPGEKDNLIDVSNARNIVAALRRAGADPKYSEYQGVGHDSWVKAYTDPELLPWLFEQKK